MALKTVSVDSGTEAQVYARRNEMERKWHSTADPLHILLRWEQRAFVIFNLENYDDPIVDREFINQYIDKRLGENHVRIQRRQCNAGATTGARRNGRDQDPANDRQCSAGRSAIDGTCWHNGARVVGRTEVLLAEKRSGWTPSRTTGRLRS